MKKLIALFILAALLLPLAACSSGTPDPAATSAGTVATETEPAPETVPPQLVPPEFNGVKYDGYEFSFLNKMNGWGIYNHEAIFVEEENGEILNDAIYGRNRKVEELFGITIKEETTTETPGNVLQRLVQAGDNAYDVIVNTSVAKLGADYLLDWYTIPGINADRLWYDQNFFTEMSVNHKLFCGVGWSTITWVDCTYGMLFNKRIAADHNVKPEDVYQAVRDGKWTLDFFEKITNDMTRDVNGDGTLDDKDTYAFIGLDGLTRLASGAWYVIAAKDAKDIPYALLDDQANIMKVTVLKEYRERLNERIYDPRTDKNTAGDGDKAVFRLFLNGQGFSYVHGFGSVQQFRDMEDDFGALPPPKYDEDQERYRLYTESTSAKPLHIMSITEDQLRTGNIIEAMSYYGYTDLRPQYYDSMMYFKYLRDEESVEMLDQYMIPNLTYRPGYGSSTLSKTFSDALSGAAEIASSIAANRSAIEKEMEEYLELFK